jgi:ribosomal protein S18 acetylase RimI-like enzyme
LEVIDVDRCLCNESEWLLTKEAFEIYKQCMYKPQYASYQKMIKDIRFDSNIFSFVCRYNGKRIGIIILHKIDDRTSEIDGIAVSDNFKHKGMGTYMLTESAKLLNTNCIIAETDDDAVGFYKAVGFEITEELKHYADGDALRYHCSLFINN